MAYYAKVRKADDFVVGLQNSPSPPTYAPTADEYAVEITEAQYNAAHSTGLKYDGSEILRYRWTGTTFAINPDTRPVVTFTPDRIKAEVGDKFITVQLDHSGGITGLREFFLAGVPTRIDFTSGVATVTIDTDLPVDFLVLPQQEFSVATFLHVTVYTRKIGPKG